MILQEPSVTCMATQLQINGLKVGGPFSGGKGKVLLKIIANVMLLISLSCFFVCRSHD